jgi:hypothetical protein
LPVKKRAKAKCARRPAAGEAHAASASFGL